MISQEQSSRGDLSRQLRATSSYCSGCCILRLNQKTEGRRLIVVALHLEAAGGASQQQVLAASLRPLPLC